MKKQGHLITAPICLLAIIYAGIHIWSMSVNAPNSEAITREYPSSIQVFGTLIMIGASIVNYMYFSDAAEVSHYSTNSRFQQILTGFGYVLAVLINIAINTGLAYLVAWNVWMVIPYVVYFVASAIIGGNNTSSRSSSMLGIGYYIMQYFNSLGRHVTNIQQKRMAIKQFYKTAKY